MLSGINEFTEVKLGLLSKANPPILVTLLGIVISVNSLLKKAACSILITPSGIVTSVRPLRSKAAAPMLVTL